MKIKLKKGATISPTCNKYGLTLEQYYNLEAGKEIEVDTVSDDLKFKITIKGNKDGD